MATAGDDGEDQGVIRSGNDSQDCSSPIGKSKSTFNCSPTQSDDSTNVCPICLEPWTNYGPHRLCSLRCGHLFGFDCIRRWLNSSANDRCPNCNKKARRNDIRLLYVRRLTAVDNTEVEAIKEGANLERKRRLTAEREITMLKMYIEDLSGEIRFLRRKEATAIPNEQEQHDLWHYEGIGRIPLPSGDNARFRVMAHSQNNLVVSRRSMGQQTLNFAGFGVRTFNANDFGTVEDIHLHGGVIRDLSFQPTSSNLLLSVGFDKCAKITDLHNSHILFSFPSSSPLWSCCWNDINSSYFYTGGSNGRVEVFDLRNPRTFIRQLPSFNNSPVHSLHFDQKGELYSLLVGQTQSISFHLNCMEEQYRRIECPLNAMISSIALDKESRHVLSTYRQSSASSNVSRLELYQLDQLTEEGGYRGPCNVFCNPGSGPLVQRSALFRRPNHPQDLIVCAGDQQSPRLNVFSTSCPNFMRQIPVDAVPLDVLGYGNSAHDKDLLAVLNSKSLQIFRLSQKE